jgi:hypothetical protein
VSCADESVENSDITEDSEARVGKLTAQNAEPQNKQEKRYFNATAYTNKEKLKTDIVQRNFWSECPSYCEEKTCILSHRRSLVGAFVMPE